MPRKRQAKAQPEPDFGSEPEQQACGDSPDRDLEDEDLETSVTEAYEDDSEMDTLAEDEELKARWVAFLGTLPLPERAVLQLYDAQAPDFGWLVGWDEPGHLVRLRLDAAMRDDWAHAFDQLESTPAGVQARKEGIWGDPTDLERVWKQRGPRLYRLLHVDLPNLRDLAPSLTAEFCKCHDTGRIRSEILAVAKPLATHPVAYWWLVFGPAVENWEGLLATLRGQSKELLVSATAASLQDGWNAEGRPRVLAMIEDPLPVS